MTQFEVMALRLLCKILMRLLQMPGARGTLPDQQYIDNVQVMIETAKKATNE